MRTTSRRSTSGWGGPCSRALARAAPRAGAWPAAVGLRCEASLGVGITGVAGPDAGENKPPGLVFVAVADPTSVRVIRLDEDHGRELNRAHAVQAALRLCGEVIESTAGAGPASPGIP